MVSRIWIGERRKEGWKWKASGWVWTGAVKAEWAVRAYAYVCKVILSLSLSLEGYKMGCGNLQGILFSIIVCISDRLSVNIAEREFAHAMRWGTCWEDEMDKLSGW